MNDTERARVLFQKSQLFFSALGNPVRQQLLMNMMGEKRLSVKELTNRTSLARPTISHHLRILKTANIIVEHKIGRETYYIPQPGENYHAVKELMDIIDQQINHNEGVAA